MELFIKKRSRPSNDCVCELSDFSFIRRILLLNRSSSCTSVNTNEGPRRMGDLLKAFNVVQRNRHPSTVISTKSSKRMIDSFLCPSGRTINAVCLFPTVAAASPEIPHLHPKSTNETASHEGQSGWTSWFTTKSDRKESELNEGQNSWSSWFTTKSNVSNSTSTFKSLYAPPPGETARQRILNMYSTE